MRPNDAIHRDLERNCRQKSQRSGEEAKRQERHDVPPVRPGLFEHTPEDRTIHPRNPHHAIPLFLTESHRKSPSLFAAWSNTATARAARRAADHHAPTVTLSPAPANPIPTAGPNGIANDAPPSTPSPTASRAPERKRAVNRARISRFPLPWSSWTVDTRTSVHPWQ